MKLLTELQYYGTMLPRIPVPIERKIKMRLVLHEEKRKRAAQNRRFLHAFREGVRVKAIYEDAENDPAVRAFVYCDWFCFGGIGGLGVGGAHCLSVCWIYGTHAAAATLQYTSYALPQWYTAVISEVVADEEDERGEDKYLVTFDGYGNQEVVTLGDLMLPPAAGSGKGEGGGGGGGGRGSSRSR